MSVYGIISEFNPFHNGHKYLIDAARAEGAGTVVCIMSGNAVQRGELSLTDKYYRAEMAISAGADLVLELPYPWCAAGAEAFALCGVRIASEFADKLFFGSECGDIGLLSRAAEIASSDGFIEEYKESLIGSVGSAEIYFDILEKKTGKKYSSNDILGIEYIKAIKKLGADMSVGTLKRAGGDYLESDIVIGTLQSATAIRKAIRSGGVDSVSGYMPNEAFNILKRAFEDKSVTDMSRLDLAMKLYFRMSAPEQFADIADIDEGLAARLCRVARECGEDNFLESLGTKRYTYSRLARAVLFAMTGVRGEDTKTLPEYINLLAANVRGRKLLAEKRKDSTITVLAKAADVPRSEGAARQAELSDKLDSIFTLALTNERPASHIIKKSPIISGEDK